jgi:hypothetical protein
MIRVTIGNNVKRKNEIFEADTTLREALESAWNVLIKHPLLSWDFVGLFSNKMLLCSLIS